MAYIADATQLRAGAIVKVEKPLSSSRRPTYPHFFVVLHVPPDLKQGSLLPLVGISSRVDPAKADPARHVSMKWLKRKGGDPDTGFVAPCHACVDFTHVLEVYSGKHFSSKSRRSMRASSCEQINSRRSSDS